jgi:predicted secreted Zn-dependent protease
MDRIKKHESSSSTRNKIIRTDISEKDDQIVEILQIDNRKMKSKTIINDPALIECQKKEESLRKHISAIRKKTVHNYKNFDKI